MNNVEIVEVSDGTDDGFDDIGYLLLTQQLPSFLQALVQRPLLHMLQYHIHVILLANNPEHLDNIRVIQVRLDLDLQRQLILELMYLDHLFGYLLESHKSPRRLMHSMVYFPEPTMPQTLADFKIFNTHLLLLRRDIERRVPCRQNRNVVF